jgi:hypothetical protein
MWRQLSLSVLVFDTPFTPLSDEIATISHFSRNSIALRERIEEGSL